MAAITAILVFRSEPSLAIFDLQVTPVRPTKFESTGLSVQEKKRKIDFQYGGHGGHRISDRNDFSYFGLQVTPMLPTKCRVYWPFDS